MSAVFDVHCGLVREAWRNYEICISDFCLPEHVYFYDPWNGDRFIYMVISMDHGVLCGLHAQ